MLESLSTLPGPWFFIGRAHPLEGLRACSLILFFIFFKPEARGRAPGIPVNSFIH